MKKTITLILLTIVLVFTALVPACSNGGVDKKQYDLAMAELTTLRDKKARAQAYSLFLDRLMWFLYDKANLPTNYKFASDAEWFSSVDSAAQAIADPKIISFVSKMKTDSSAYLELQKYVIDQIVTTLQ